MNIDYIAIGQRIRKILKKHFTQEKLAEKLDVSSVYISRKLCTGLGISLADFFADQATELPDQMKPLVSHLVSFARTLTPDQKEALKAIGKRLADIT